MKRRSPVKLALAIGWTIAVVWGSLTSGSNLQSTGMFNLPYFDKVLHFLAYFLFVFLWINTKEEVKSQKTVIQWIVIGSLLGVAVECAQYAWTTDRRFENLDIIANIIGSIGGGIAFNWKIKTTKYVK
jgi:VanZ family protein